MHGELASIEHNFRQQTLKNSAHGLRIGGFDFRRALDQQSTDLDL
ncbi:hypothetical protein [Solilutibacter silvestris]